MSLVEKKKAQENTYVIQPPFKQKFQPTRVKQIIKLVMHEKLANATYQADTVSSLTKDIAEDVKNKLKDLQLPRYKFLVQVVIGEQRGQGVRMGSRSFWDSQTDNVASEVFINDSIFCVVTAYGVYLY